MKKTLSLLLAALGAAQGISAESLITTPVPTRAATAVAPRKGFWRWVDWW